MPGGYSTPNVWYYGYYLCVRSIGIRGERAELQMHFAGARTRRSGGRFEDWKRMFSVWGLDVHGRLRGLVLVHCIVHDPGNIDETTGIAGTTRSYRTVGLFEGLVAVSVASYRSFQQKPVIES